MFQHTRSALHLLILLSYGLCYVDPSMQVYKLDRQVFEINVRCSQVKFELLLQNSSSINLLVGPFSKGVFYTVLY